MKSITDVNLGNGGNRSMKMRMVRRRLKMYMRIR